MEFIEFKNITKRFSGTTALNDVTFGIKKGEVHAIVGANGAGKSTLMNILGGQLKQTSGEIVIDGKQVSFSSPYESRLFGVGVVYQELKLCDNLSVVQNIFLGSEIKNKYGRMDWNSMTRQAQEVLDQLEAGINAKEIVGNLSIGKKQMVEISKALCLNASVVIFDEPTSSLSYKDSQKLFATMRMLQTKGVTQLFISHRIEEVFSISDRISVLRDGCYMGTYTTGDTAPETIVDEIAGKQLTEELANRDDSFKHGEEVVLKVKGFSRERKFQEVDFQLYKGEILGIYGLQGSGRTELLESIFGYASHDAGEMALFGESVVLSNTKAAIDRGLAMVSEDRRFKGIFPNFDVKENIAIISPAGTIKNGLLNNAGIQKISKAFIKKFNIVVSDVTQGITSLSGGNQQKVMISRCLSKVPKILLLDEVSRGIDVGSKAEIFKSIRALREDGLSIVFVSSEVEEIMAECDRVLIMWNGRIVAEYDKSIMDSQQIIKSAMGY